jgi:hypothetical protein
MFYPGVITDNGNHFAYYTKGKIEILGFNMGQDFFIWQKTSLNRKNLRIKIPSFLAPGSLKFS